MNHSTMQSNMQALSICDSAQASQDAQGQSSTVMLSTEEGDSYLEDIGLSAL